VLTRAQVLELLMANQEWPQQSVEPEVVLILQASAYNEGEASMRQRAATTIDPTGVLGLAATILALPLTTVVIPPAP
jgi:hypothetical protein